MNLRQFYTGKAIGFIIVLIVLGIVAGFYSLNNYIYNEKQAYTADSYKNAEYIINGGRIRLVGGVAKTEVSGSSSEIITRYFGNEVTHDFDGDGREDAAFLLTQETGGSGTFYYVVVALNTIDGYIGSEGLFLGDRIAPQSTNMGTGNIFIVNYADRKPGESFAVQPSVGKSIWLLLDKQTMQLGEVAQNFEGEADPSRMKLTMKEWVWIKALYNDGREVMPRSPGAFKLTFSDNKTFSLATDCNSAGGKYTVNGNKISFTEMVSTLMYCEGSQEGEFAQLLSNTTSYLFTSKGELILELKFDSGTVTFR